MCTQEIVWCSCGHGELLPIVKCAKAEATGVCYTVVHGDHRVVLHMECSYCLSGLSERAALSTKARPEGELAAMIEKRNEGQTVDGKPKDGEEASTAGEASSGVNLVDWHELGEDQQLWQYV